MEGSENLSGKPTLQSETHDILYSKARYVINQRHIKRPWFNLNPFLEKTDETIDLENYLPEESKYIQALESLVLCEKYSDDTPVDTRELALGHFFDYLYSDEWTDGCSVRVLEGVLLSQMLTGLYRMEKNNKTVRHTTYAVARNHRPRTGCYKLADKESYGSIDETLLIEFAYFGRLTKPHPNPIHLNPLEYLRLGLSELDDDTDLPILPMMPLGHEMPQKRGRTTSVALDGLFFKSLNFNLPQDVANEVKNEQRRRSSVLMSKPLNAIRFMNAAGQGNSKTRRQTLAGAGSSTPLAPLFQFKAIPEKPIPEKKRDSTQYDGADPAKIRSRRRTSEYLNSQKPGVKYYGCKYSPIIDDETPTPDADEQDKQDNEDKEDEKDKDNFFGEEFFLSDQKSKKVDNKEPVEMKLQRKKRELQERRKQMKKSKDEQEKKVRNSGIPALPPLDLESIKTQGIGHATVNLPDELPTFEEFIKLLKEDEYYDPRYRNKVRLKGKKIAERYYMAKGTRRCSMMFSGDNLPSSMGLPGLRGLPSQLNSNIRQSNAHIQGQNQQRYPVGGGSRATVRLPPLSQGQKRGSMIDQANSSTYGRDNQRFADEVLGVTDSEPCKEHSLQNRGSVAKARDKRSDNQTNTLINETDDKQLKKGSSKSVMAPFPPKIQLTATSSKSPPTAMFSRSVSGADDESDSPESSSEASETQTDEESPDFDPNKLNVKYSIERLRKKKRMTKKKKPAFFDVLAKYYKVNDAVSAFNKQTAVTPDVKKAKQRAKRIGLGKFLKDKVLKKPDKMVVGKMKRFPFQDISKSKKRLNLDNLSTGDFTVPEMDEFFRRLQDAIDDFVVRREIVVTDLQTFCKSVTSVTFTRKPCFQHKHKQCC